MKTKDNTITVRTTYSADLIKQTVECDGELPRFVNEQILYHLEEQTKSALVKLGWTPPTDKWYTMDEKEPEIGQKVYYFFDVVGVVAGVYSAFNTFSSPRGFLTGDVTHWMPRYEPKSPLEF